MNSKSKKFKSYIGLLIALFMITGSFSFAQQHLQPVKEINAELKGTKDGDHFTASGSVNWFYEIKNDSSIGFRVYYAQGKTDNKENLQLLAEIGYNDSARIGKGQYRLPISQIFSNHNIMTFTVTAFNKDGESEIGKFVFAEIKNSQPVFKLMITGHPELHAKIGEEYTFIPKLETNIENPILKYSLIMPPDGAVIDEATGKVTWTPTKGGNYNFKMLVQASLNDKVIAASDFVWNVNVAECDVLSVINAKVTDGNDNLLAVGSVTVFQYKNSDSIMRKVPVFQTKFEHGQFEIKNLDKGTYYIVVEAFSKDNSSKYYPNWYENALNFENATPLEIGCGDTKEITFIMKEIPQPKHYVVSGKVVDSETLEPIKNVVVEFSGTSYDLNKTQYFTFMTNANGVYEGKLPDELQYIAVARASGKNSHNDTIFGGQGYFPQFYELADNPTDAKLIILTANKNDIDFYLKAVPDYKNSVSGSVVNGDEEAVKGAEVTAFLVDADGDNYKYLYFGKSSKVTENGDYKIENLIPGNYVILARPFEREMAPGFYVENDKSTLSWEDATRVTVTNESNNGGYKIILNATEKIHGKGIVKGNVRKDKKGIIKSGDEVQGLDPLNGASVYLVNSKNNVTNEISTDAAGKFEFGSIPAGKYTLVIDKVGFASSKTEITLGEESVVEKDVEMAPIVTSGVNDTQVSFGIEIYPNPAAESINISFASEISGLEVSLITYNGTEIFKKSVDNSVSSVSLNTENISSGMYFVKIRNGNSISVKSVAVIK